MTYSLNRRQFKLWKSRDRESRGRRMRRRLGQLLEPRIMLAADSDLVVPTATAPQTAVMGEAVAVSWTVKNQGLGVADRFWRDAVYLSADTTLDTAVDTQLLHRQARFEGALQPGAQYTAQRNVVIPTTVEGTQYLLFVTDSADAQEEIVEANNVFAVPIDVTAPDVDLVITAGPTDASLVAGQSVAFGWTVQNSGSDVATAFSWQDRVFLSTDTIHDDEDRYVGAVNTNSFLPLGPGESYSMTLGVNALNSDLAGDQYLLFVTDYSGQQGETDLTNNVVATPIHIAAPNLTLGNVVAPTVAEAGQTIEVSLQVTNQGSVPALANWRDAIYFSLDNTLDSDRFLVAIDADHGQPAEPGQSYTSKMQFTLPNNIAGDGHLLFVVDSDGVQAETDETDNVFAWPISIPAADLDVTDVVMPTTAVAGDTIDVTWSVANVGTGVAVTDWTDAVYFSTDPILDDDDRRLQTESAHNQSPLPPGASYEQFIRLDLEGVELGNHYLLFSTDDRAVQPESDELNNVHAVPIALTAPNLVASGLNLPATATAGSEITVQWVVSNDSERAANGDWYDSLYLSADEWFDPSDIGLGGNGGLSPLGAGESYSQERTVRLPGETGEQFILAVIDQNADQGETDEGDNVIAQPIVIAPHPTNLVPTDFAAPGTAASGETIGVTWTVSNAATESVNNSWYDSIYLSADDQWDSGDQTLMQLYQGSRSPLAAGASYTETVEVSLQGSAAGSRYLLIRTDSNDAQFEADETDNVRAIPIEITLPNLTVTDVAAPAIAASGEKITVAWTVTNDSDVVAAGDWSDSIYLSHDDRFDANDRSLKSISTSASTPLAAGESYAWSNHEVHLSNVGAGDYYLLVVTNSNLAQGESDDYDNVFATPLHVDLPDVLAKDFNAPSSAVLGQTLNLTWSVENISDLIVTGTDFSWRDEIYLSDDPFLNRTIDTRLASKSIRSETPLDPGEFYTAALSAVLPSFGTGSKYMILSVDATNAQYESNEDNNLIVVPIELNAPDLVVSDSTSPETAVIGERIDMTWTVTNQGDHAASANWRDYVYLSDDEIYDSNDRHLLNQNASNLNAGESYTRSGGLTLNDVDPGNHYLLFVTDRIDQQGETDNDNNVRAVPITLTAPDIVVTAASAPLVVNLGESIDVTWTVKNDGTVPAVSSWSDGFYLSRDDKLDGSDRSLRTVSASNEAPLDPGSQYTKTQTVQISERNVPSGNRYLLVVADSQSRQSETDETNNVFAIPIELKSPDLIVTNITAPSIVKPGQEAEISWTVQNIGDGTATQNWRDFVAITDDKELSCPYECGEFDLDLTAADEFVPLAPGESYTQTKTLTIPQRADFGDLLTPGNYFLGVKADESYGSDQDESNEDNNEFFIPISVIAPDVDLVVSDLIVPESAQLGETIEVTATITNLGTETATGTFGSWTDQIRLSDDELFSSDDKYLFNRNNRDEIPLAGGQSYTFTQEVTIASNATGGNRFIVLQTDTNSQVETDETNNFAAAPINILAPNLVITNHTAPQVAALSQTINVSWTVKNDGPVTALADWRDRVYLSDDPFFGSGDRNLTEWNASVNSPLAPGASYTANRTFTFNNVTAGSKFLLFITDVNNHQGETDEGDNVVAVPIELASADLVLTDISGPSEVAVGETVSILRTVQNQGVGPAPANWSDAVYLSIDTTIDSSDPRVGTATASGYRPLGVGNEYTAPIEVTIPDVPPGDYYFIVKTDAFSAQAEISESNNIEHIPVTIAAPDLALANAILPTDAVTNGPISVSYTVANVSTITARSDWEDRVYLSSDGTLEGVIGAPLVVESIVIQTPLAPDESYTIVRELTLPGVEPGDYFVVLEANSNHGQGETDLSNNVHSEPISITAPNLRVVEATGPESGLVNEMIDVSYRVVNDSLVDAFGDWSDWIWLSDDATLDPTDDLLLGSVPIEDQTPLADGAGYDVTRTVTLPGDSTGEKFLLVQTNGNQRQGETSSTDNVLAAAISVAPPPNLVVTQINAPETVAVHQTIPISFTVTNTGTTPAVANWTDVVRLFDDADLSAGNLPLKFLGVDESTPLAPGASYTVETTVTMPGVAGDRFLMVRANQAEYQGESTYTDNHRFRPIRLLAPDLTIGNPSGPTEGTLGEPIAFSYTVTNASNVSALTQWRDQVFLSTDPNLDAGDIAIPGGEILAPTTLGDGESYVVNRDIILPPFDIGNHYLIVKTDIHDHQLETEESNNTAVAIPILLRASDLTVSDIGVPSEAVSGRAFNVSWTVTNTGDGPVSNWIDRVAISSDTGIGGDLVLGDFPFAGTLLPGESVTRTQGAVSPIQQSGPRYVVVTADPANAKPESNEQNNSALSTDAVDILQAPIPNLQPSGVTSSTNDQDLFAAFEVEWVVSNVGSGATDTPVWRDEIYLSVDQALDSTDVRIGSQINPNYLNAGEAYTSRASVFAHSVSEGDYYLLVFTDSRNNVQEHSGETDNVVVGPQIHIRFPPPPDLVVSNVIAPELAFSGQPMAISWMVTNQGDATAISRWDDAVYMSMDAVLDADDRLLSTVPYQTLYQVHRTVSYSGDYESCYGVPAPDPVTDLYFQSPNLDSATAVYANLIGTDRRQVVCSVPGGLGGFIETAYRETSYDFEVIENRLVVDESYARNVQVQLPVGVSGDYYFFVVTDVNDRVHEFAFDGNNDNYHAIATTIHLTPPPDLEVTEVVAPESTTAGRPFNISYSTWNVGATRTPNTSWRDAFYLSMDDQFDPETDRFLGDRGISFPAHSTIGQVGGLDVDRSYTRDVTLTMPNGLSGEYYLIAVADRLDDVFEIDNANNLFVSANPIDVVLESPDLYVTAVATDESVRAGESLSVQWTVTNQGDGDTITQSWTDSIYASVDDQIGNDIWLGSFTHHGRVDPGQSYERFATVGVPLSLTGSVRLYVRTDVHNSVAEFGGESNNESSLQILDVIRETADLQVSATAFAAENGRIRLGWQVENVGTNQANSSHWRDAVYLSKNDTFGDDDDIRLTSVFVSQTDSLPSGSSYSVDRQFDIPFELNDFYHFFVIVDEQHQVDESLQEANNVVRLGQIDTSSIRSFPDLVVTQVDAPIDAISGQYFEVSWTVRNVGDPIVAGEFPPEHSGSNWIDAVYLSRDQVFDAHSDFYLGRSVIAKSDLIDVPNGSTTVQEYTQTGIFRVPDGLTGPLYLMVLTDRGDEVIEIGAEHNNQGLDAESMFVSLAEVADLAIGVVNVPDNAALGSSIELTYALENQGANRVTGRWLDRLYLSTDDQFSLDDVSLGLASHGLNIIEPGESKAFDFIRRLPPVLPGDYHVILRTDAFNAIPESDELNNLGASLETFHIDVATIGLIDGAGATEMEATIGSGQTRSFYYRFAVQAGQTIAIDGVGIDLPSETYVDHLGNEQTDVRRDTESAVYVGFERVPTPIDYDFAETAWLSSTRNDYRDQRLVIPRTEAGHYYLRVDVTDRQHGAFSFNEISREHLRVELSSLPFSIISVNPAVVGNAGRATLDVTASNLNLCSAAELWHEGERVRTSDQIRLDDATSGYVTFDFDGLQPGQYELRLSDHGGSIASYDLEVEDGVGARVDGSIHGPRSVRAGREYVFYANYGNNGDSDGIAPLLLVTNLDASPMALTRAGLPTQPQAGRVVQALGISPTGDAGILRPGQLNSVPVFFQVVGQGQVGRFQLHTITADDTRPLDFASIESDLRPEELSADQWDELRPQVQDRIGTTWGSYVRALSQAATRLADAGNRTSDIRSLLASIVHAASQPATPAFSGHVVESTSCSIVSNPIVRAVSNDESHVAYSDSAGRFSFDQLPHGTYDIVVDAVGWARTVVNAVDIGADAPSLVVNMAPEGVIAGALQLGVGGVAESGTYVQARRTGAPQDASGEYRFQSTDTEFALGGLPAGTYDVVVGRTGYIEHAMTVTVAEGETVDIGQIPLEALPTIRGTVVSELDEFPAADAVVGIFQAGLQIAASYVRIDGSFELAIPAVGEFELRVVNNPTGYVTAETVTVAPGETTDPIQLRVTHGATITGTVRDRDDNTTLPGILVIARDSDGGVLSARSDAEGRYRFTELKIDEYVVSVANGSLAVAQNVDIDQIRELPYMADLTATVSGQVTGVVTDSAGIPLAGAAVSLTIDGQSVLTSRTDSQGRYRFLLDSDQTDLGLLVAYDGASFAPVSGLQVTEQTTTTQNFQAGSETLQVSIAGTAGDDTEALVIVKHSIGGRLLLAGTRLATTDAPVVFTHLVPGDYEVTVQRGTHAGGTVNVTIESGASTEIPVLVTERHTINGRLLDGQGQPVGSATIGLTATDGFGTRRVAVTTADGRFELSGIPAGSYDAVVHADGFEIEILSGLSVPETTALNLTLESTESEIIGRVVDLGGSPIVYATVQAADATGRVLVSTEVDPDGSFAFSGLVGDDFTLSVSQPGAIAQTIGDLSVATDVVVDVGEIAIDSIAIGQGFGIHEQISAAGELEPAFFSSFIDSMVGSLIPFVADLLGDGDPEKLPDHFPTSDVPELPTGCTVCAEQEVQAVIAATNQNIKYNAYESAYNQFEQQSLVVNSLFVADIATLAGALAGVVVAIDGLLAYSAYAVMSQSLSTVGTTAVGTYATGTVAVGTTVTTGPAAAGLLGSAGASFTFANTVAGVSSTILGIDGIIEGIFNGNSSASTTAGIQAAKSTLESAKSTIEQLQSWFPSVFSTTNETGNAGAVGSGFGLANSIAGAFTSIKGAIEGIISPMQNFENALTYLGELEDDYLQAKGTYELVVQTANEKLNGYLGCLAVNECEPDDNGNGNNNGSGNDGNDPDTGPIPPVPPTPPNPPNILNPFLIQSQDPNDIVGPDGFGEEGWVGANQTLPYMIRFENVPEATGPAQRVTIEQQLDEDLDPRTFRVDDFGWGEFRMELDADQPFFQGRVELPDGSGLVVDVTATVDVVSGLLTWVFQTIDPAIGVAPEDALAGFLPPNINQGEGEGFVMYTVRPRRNSPSGTRIDADATIVFDTNEPIDTPDIFNTLDGQSGNSRVGDLPSTSEQPQFQVQWSGEDDQHGSALADFTVFVSIDDGPWQPWLTDTTLNEAVYVGQPGRRYAFVTTSRDNAGNVEPLVWQPDTFTVVEGGDPASIGNLVWSDSNQNGIRDAGEPGIAGVTVHLLDGAGVKLLSTITDADGNYQFDGVEPNDSYAIELVPQAGYSLTNPDQGVDDTIDSDFDPITYRSTHFVALPGENFQWDAGFVPLGSISGIVWDDQNGNGQRESTEPALAGWTVYLDSNQNAQHDASEPSQTTDSEGKYLFDDLSPGSYSVAQMIPPGWNQTFPGVVGANSVSDHSSVFPTTEPMTLSAAAELIELDRLRDSDSWAGYTGSGYAVVVIDSGIDPDHPFFGPDGDGDGVADRIVYQYDFADDDSDASDRTGHGSHLAGVIASEDRSQIGIAPDVNVIALKVFGDDGRGAFADVERALQWVVANADQYNIAAVNLSFGDGANWSQATSQYGLGDELAWLSDHGVITVTATGNRFDTLGGDAGVQYPAADPHTIAVGSVGDSDQTGDWSDRSAIDHTIGVDRISGFSQRHPELTDVFAPGAWISGANAFGGQTKLRGTSQAASFVAGAAVLAQQIAWEQHAVRLTTEQFRDLLNQSNVPIQDGDDQETDVSKAGAEYGRLDLHALAVGIADLVTSSNSVAAAPLGTGGQSIAPLTDLNLPYQIDLEPGEDRSDVDFGNQRVPVGAPTVDGIVQLGLAQRSSIDTLQFDFSELVNLADLIADGSIVGAVRIHDLGINVDTDPDQSVPLTAAQFRYEFDDDSGISRLVWSLDEFAGSNVSLDDGMYEVVLDASLIEDAEGNPLDGDGNEIGGDDYRFVFHRLRGDVDGSRLVDAADMNLVNAALGARPGLPHWNPNVDLDRDERISVRDRVIVAAANGNGIIDSPNAGSSFDANADGKVSALDALVIINRLAHASVDGQSGLDPFETRDRLDVNRDGRVSALDALQVINQLADLTTSLLAVVDQQSTAGDPTPLVALATDFYFCASDGDRDFDDDEWLRLLADDQARIDIGGKL